MNVFDKVLEVTGNNEDLAAKAMLVTESYILNEITELDAITKWEEIFRATEQNREINFIPYEPTGLKNLLAGDDYLKKALDEKCEKITTELFDNMTVENFEHHVMEINFMLHEAKKLNI